LVVLDVLELSIVGSYISLLAVQSPLNENISSILSWFGVSLELNHLLVGPGIILLIVFALKARFFLSF